MYFQIQIFKKLDDNIFPISMISAVKLIVIPKEVLSVRALNSFVSIQVEFCYQMSCEQTYESKTK